MADGSAYPDLNSMDLHLVSGIYSCEGKTVDFVGDMAQTLKITAQENGAFKGTMEQVVGSENVTLGISGVLYAYGDKVVCRFTESNNHIWDMHLNKDATYAVVSTVMISDIDSITEGKMLAIERQYVADGAEIPEINTTSGLKGDWTLKTSTQIDINGKVSDVADSIFNISVLDSSGLIASGTYTYNGIIGYASIYSSYTYPINDTISVHMFQSPASSADLRYSNIAYGYISADGNKLTLMSQSMGSDNSLIMTSNVFEKSDYSDVLGDWKFVNGEGGNASEDFKSVTRSSDSFLTKYDLTIDTCKNGFIEGKVGDIPFVGTYYGGYISYEVETDAVSINASGNFSDGKLYMTLLTVEKNGEKWDGASWDLAYTKDGKSASIDTPKSVDMSKEWTLVSGNSFNGEDHILAGNKLTITQYDGSRIVGTMEQVVGDEVVEKLIVGNVHVWEDRIIGNVIDDTGNIWALNAGSDYLRLVAAMESEISGIAGQPVAAERIYTADGENAPVIKQDIDLTNTEWKSIYAVGIANGAVYTDNTGAHSIKFTAQNGNLVVGTETSSHDFLENETFSAYTYSGGGVVGISMLGINENGGHSHYTAFFSADGKQMYTTIISYSESGEQSVENALFEKI